MTLLREDREWWFPGQFNAIHIRATSCRTAVPIPVHRLDAVATLVFEDEQVPGQGIKMHGADDDSAQ